MAVDFPSGDPNIPNAALTGETLGTMHGGAGHPAATNRLITNIKALAAKLGYGSSLPGAAAGLLRRTAAGSSAWGQAQAGDIVGGGTASRLLRTSDGTAVAWAQAQAADIVGGGTANRLLRTSDGTLVAWSQVLGPDLGAGTGRTYTLYVAASNANALTKLMADYTCDGVADQVEINNALAALPAVGGTVMLSEGTFTLAAGVATAKDNSHLRGHGAGATTLQVVNAGGAAVNTALVFLLHANCSLRDLFIDGNKANNAAQTGMIGWRIATTNCLIQNVVSTNSAGLGAQVGGGGGALILECRIATNASDGIYVDSPGLFNVMQNCSIQSNGGQGVNLTAGTMIVRGCLFLGNTMNGLLVAAGTGCRIVENYAASNGTNGITINGGNNHLVAHNIAVGNSQNADNTYMGIQSNGSTDSLFIGNITRRGAGANKQKYGLAISSAANAYVGANDLIDGGTTGDFIDNGSNTKRLVKRLLTYTAGSIHSGTAIAGSTETLVLDNQTFTTTLTTGITVVYVRMGLQIDFTAAVGLVGALLRIDSAAGATMSGTQRRLSSERVQTAAENVVVGGGTIVLGPLSPGAHTIKVTAISEQAGAMYCRNNSLEFLEIDILEYAA